MKAIRVEAFGDPEVMKVQEIDAPEVKPGTVLVKVEAIGVNPVDTYIRSGLYGVLPLLPYTPGMDAAGEVLAVGEGAGQVAVGDRVFIAGTISGAYAEQCLCAANQVFPLGEGATFAQGAALGVPYGTAYRAIHHRAQVRAKESVLVHGASGGVGLAAVQILKAMDATVIATAGSDEGMALVQSQGADYVINHHEPDHLKQTHAAAGGSGVDVILEMLANVNLGDDLPILAKHGRVVVIGSRGEVTINPRDLMTRDAAVLGMTLMNVEDEDRAEIYGSIARGIDQQWVKPVVSKEYPLAEAPQAHIDVMETSPNGKLVLIP